MSFFCILTPLGKLIRVSSLFPNPPATFHHRHDMRPYFLFIRLFVCFHFHFFHTNPSFPRPSTSLPSCPSHLQSILSSLIQLEEELEEAEEEEEERSTRGSACLPGEDISGLLQLRAREKKKNKFHSAHSHPGSVSGRTLKPAGVERRYRAAETVTKRHSPHALTGVFFLSVVFFFFFSWQF